MNKIIKLHGLECYFVANHDTVYYKRVNGSAPSTEQFLEGLVAVLDSISDIEYPSTSYGTVTTTKYGGANYFLVFQHFCGQVVVQEHRKFLFHETCNRKVTAYEMELNLLDIASFLNTYCLHVLGAMRLLHRFEEIPSLKNPTVKRPIATAEIPTEYNDEGKYIIEPFEYEGKTFYNIYLTADYRCINGEIVRRSRPRPTTTK